MLCGLSRNLRVTPETRGPVSTKLTEIEAAEIGSASERGRDEKEDSPRYFLAIRLDSCARPVSLARRNRLSGISEHGLAGVEIDFTNEVEVSRCSSELAGTIGNVQRIGWATARRPKCCDYRFNWVKQTSCTAQPDSFVR